MPLHAKIIQHDRAIEKITVTSKEKCCFSQMVTEDLSDELTWMMNGSHLQIELRERQSQHREQQVKRQ